MSNKQVIIHARMCEEHGEYEEEYFFSTDHLQGVRGGTYPKGFVPVTYYLPQSVVPRPSLPSGIVSTVEDVITIFYPRGKEIPNPDPRYQLKR